MVLNGDELTGGGLTGDELTGYLGEHSQEIKRGMETTLARYSGPDVAQ